MSAMCRTGLLLTSHWSATGIALDCYFTIGLNECGVSHLSAIDVALACSTQLRSIDRFGPLSGQYCSLVCLSCAVTSRAFIHTAFVSFSLWFSLT